MKTDSLFYRLFQTAPAILLELIGQSEEDAIGYEFQSLELKQTALRIDGVLLPTEASSQRPVYFVEVQFQRDEGLYHRLFTELLFYLKHHPDTADWRAVIIYPKRNLEPQRQDLHQELLTGRRVMEIYLEDLAKLPELTLGVELAKLIIEPQGRAIAKAKELLERSKRETLGEVSTTEVIDLIETIIVYKFENLGRKEIEAMLGLGELRQTKVYQEALEEGREEGREEGLRQERQAILERLLQRSFGEPDQELRDGITNLITLPSDLFLAIVVALSQPPECWSSAVTGILQARFNSVPPDLETTLNGVKEPERRVVVLRKAIAALSWEEIEADLEIVEF